MSVNHQHTAQRKGAKPGIEEKYVQLNQGAYTDDCECHQWDRSNVHTHRSGGKSGPSHITNRRAVSHCAATRSDVKAGRAGHRRGFQRTKKKKKTQGSRESIRLLSHQMSDVLVRDNVQCECSVAHCSLCCVQGGVVHHTRRKREAKEQKKNKKKPHRRLASSPVVVGAGLSLPASSPWCLLLRVRAFQISFIHTLTVSQKDCPHPRLSWLASRVARHGNRNGNGWHHGAC